MSAQVLARKWRPKAFADLIGQEHICRTLINGLNAKRLHHAYLFCGTRGVGKTTLARILAKSFACERSQDAEPCNACPHCRAIDEGNYPDLLEVDAASRTGVEDTRELLGDTQFAPIRGKYKTYLIDEVHMLSNHSFNALLKTLEEPPPHILFLFATTDPQKVPITVLSRCLKFNLKPIQEDAIRQQLDKILKAEKIQHDPGSLKHLAQQARGSMRDALSLADQAIAYCRGKLQEDETAQMLGVAGIPPAAVLLKDLVQDDMKALLAVTERVENDGGNFSDFADRLLEALQSIAILQVNKTPAHEDPELRGLVTQLSPEEVQLYYQIVLLTKKELPWCPSPRRAFEMGLIRMLTLQPVLTENFVAIPKRVDRLKPDASQTQTMVSPAPDPQQEGNDTKKEGTEEHVNEGETIDRHDAVNPQPKQEKEPSDPPAKSETDPDTNPEDAKDEPTSQAGDASVASTRTVANEQETQAKTLDLGMATPEEQAEVDARSQSMKEKADNQDESSEVEEEIDTEDEAPKGKEETDTQDEVRRAGEEVDAEDEAPKGKEETDTQDEVRKAGEKAATEDESPKRKKRQMLRMKPEWRKKLLRMNRRGRKKRQMLRMKPEWQKRRQILKMKHKKNQWPQRMLGEMITLIPIVGII